MYNCDVCGVTSKAGEKAIKRVMQDRPVVYTETYEIRGREIEREIGRGREIVREAMLCEECAAMVDKVV